MQATSIFATPKSKVDKFKLFFFYILKDFNSTSYSNSWHTPGKLTLFAHNLLLHEFGLYACCTRWNLRHTNHRHAVWRDCFCVSSMYARLSYPQRQDKPLKSVKSKLEYNEPKFMCSKSLDFYYNLKV